MVYVINLSADIGVLIPCKRSFSIWIIRNKDDILIYDPILHCEPHNPN